MVLCLLLSLSILTYANCQSKEDVHFYLCDEAYQRISEDEEINHEFSHQKIALNEYSTIFQQLTIDQFGGAYFDNDGMLHVLLTADTAVPATLTTYICYDVAMYSYDQLVAFQTALIDKREEIGFDVSGIDQEENMVIIYSAQPLNLALLYTLIPQNAVKIVTEEPILSNCSTHTVIPGQKIRNTTNNTFGSITCGVVWGNTYGFMTAGHLGDIGDSVSYDNASMGTITKKQECCSVDAALIQRGQNNNVFNYANEVADGKVFEKVGGTFPKNTVIYAYGASTTYRDNGTISGKITNTNFSGTFDGVHFTGLILTDAVSQSGDSGGPVLTAYEDTYSIIGALKGTYNGKMVYVNMNDIKSMFDLNVVVP